MLHFAWISNFYHTLDNEKMNTWFLQLFYYTLPYFFSAGATDQQRNVDGRLPSHREQVENCFFSC